MYVVRKKLRSRKLTRELRNEKMLLRLLNQLRHPNVIRLLGSYTHQGNHFFLFPCIDMDLKRFFTTEDRFGNFRWDLTFYSALRGLSSALLSAHSLRLKQEVHGIDFEAIGYHHDIRPANILVSQTTFILADFGLGNLKPTEAESQTPFKPGVGDYLAPESDDEDQHFTRAVDVWAFGCLVADIITYMAKGPLGIIQFSDKRLSPGRRAGWEDSMFYGHEGQVKSEVKDWLETLGHTDAEGRLTTSLVTISLQALTCNPQKRPKMQELCNSLTCLSVRAHYLSVTRAFRGYLELSSSDETRGRVVTNNIWFLQQRFRVWGHILFLDGSETATEQLPLLDRLHDEFINTMVELFHKLEIGEKAKSWQFSPSKDSDTKFALETELDQLVEKLWAHLPTDLERRATDYWHQAILSTDDTNDLVHIGQRLRLRYGVHSVSHAMAMMRKVRLDLLRPDSLEGAKEARKIPRSEVKVLPQENGHSIGKYQGEPVLVERTWHSSMWDSIHPDQRELVIGLKARSLNHESKPIGLKTLSCIGLIEQDGSDQGYELVFQCPDGHESTPLTLLGLLEDQKAKPYEQPALGDKFRLAFALANFLKEYHTVGWLHENFNPNNILFFGPPPGCDDGRPRRTSTPYVVGLHKSRPDGSFWQTDGPEPGADFQDYQHPKYTGGRERYRPEFDYYSLGVVLLEIGLWRPLHSWQSKFRDSTATEVRSELIKTCRARLAMKMGVTYRDAVLCCLDDSLDDGSKMEFGGQNYVSLRGGNHALDCFTEQVVAPLEKLAMAMI